MNVRTPSPSPPKYECKIVSQPLVCATHQAIAVRSTQNPNQVKIIGYYPLKTTGGPLSDRLLGMLVSPLRALFESTGKHSAVLLSNDPMFDKVDISPDGWVPVNKSGEILHLLDAMKKKELEERQPFEGVAHYLARMVALRKAIEEK